MIQSLFLSQETFKGKIKHLQGEREKKLWNTSKMTPNSDIISRYQKTFLKIISLLFSLYTFTLHSSAHIFYAPSKSFYSWTNQPQACSQTTLAFGILKAVTEDGLKSFQEQTKQEGEKVSAVIQILLFVFMLYSSHLIEHPRSMNPH